MMKVSAAALAALSTLAAASPALASDASAAKASTRAIVMVSGGAAISPFTTPKSACKAGFAAGITHTQIRGFLLSKGYQVFTAPAAGRYQPSKYEQSKLELPDDSTRAALARQKLSQEKEPNKVAVAKAKCTPIISRMSECQCN